MLTPSSVRAHLHIVGGRALHASVLHLDAADGWVGQLGKAQRLDIDVISLALGASVWAVGEGRVRNLPDSREDSSRSKDVEAGSPTPQASPTEPPPLTHH